MVRTFSSVAGGMGYRSSGIVRQGMEAVRRVRDPFASTAIIGTLRTAGEPLTAAEIIAGAAARGWPAKAVRPVLIQMVKEGILMRCRGRYALAT